MSFPHHPKHSNTLVWTHTSENTAETSPETPATDTSENTYTLENTAETGRETLRCCLCVCCMPQKRWSTLYLMQCFTEEIAEKISVDLHLCELVDILHVEDSDVDELDLWDGQKKALKRRRNDLLKAQGKGMLYWPHVMGVNTLSEV
jgi:hypothetical protein